MVARAGWHHGPVATRTYQDRCPGVFRPWAAEDGAIVRLRVPGGRISAEALLGVVAAAVRYGDGTVLLTRRANLQLRGIATEGGAVPGGLVEAVAEAGLLPSRTHELVRNILVSPLTGLLGGRLDLRPVVRALDDALLADPALAGLGGRFLFVLDDGRGDVAWRDLDLGLIAVDPARVQLRIGATGWGPVVPVDRAATELARLAGEFARVRGTGPTAHWHVDELPDPAVLGARVARDPATEVTSEPPSPGRHGRGIDVVALPDGLVRRPLAEQLAGAAGLVVTPWRSIVVEESTVEEST
jgi:precorrin-3B synthase